MKIKKTAENLILPRRGAPGKGQAFFALNSFNLQYTPPLAGR
jgi:hypothetical protein